VFIIGVMDETGIVVREGVSRGRLGKRKKQNPNHSAMPQSRRLKRPWRIQRRRRASD